MPASVGIVIVAAGSGLRFGGDVPKAFVELDGRTVLGWSLVSALQCPGLVGLVVVAPAGHLDDALGEVDRYAPAVQRPLVGVVAGGAERHHSVAAGLAALTPEADVVLVHDAARAMAPPSLFAAVSEAVVAGAPAAVPGLPVVDTVKQVDDREVVIATLPRPDLRIIQTPQGFRRDVLRRAHDEAPAGVVTDDATLVELLGLPVLVIPGDPQAFKITTTADVERLVVVDRRSVDVG